MFTDLMCVLIKINCARDRKNAVFLLRRFYFGKPLETHYRHLKTPWFSVTNVVIKPTSKTIY